MPEITIFLRLDKDDLSDPEIRLDELMHLAELCIEVTQQNEEYHSEVTFDDFLKVPILNRSSTGSRSIPVVYRSDDRSQ